MHGKCLSGMLRVERGGALRGEESSRGRREDGLQNERSFPAVIAFGGLFHHQRTKWSSPACDGLVCREGDVSRRSSSEEEELSGRHGAEAR